MKRYRIENEVSGVVFGVYPGNFEGDALDAFARDAGYEDYEECCEVTGQDTETNGLVVTEVSEDEED